MKLNRPVWNGSGIGTHAKSSASFFPPILARFGAEGPPPPSPPAPSLPSLPSTPQAPFPASVLPSDAGPACTICSSPASLASLVSSIRRENQLLITIFFFFFFLLEPQVGTVLSTKYKLSNPVCQH